MLEISRGRKNHKNWFFGFPRIHFNFHTPMIFSTYFDIGFWQVSVQIYVGGVSQQYINFNTEGDYNFFFPNNITSSSWVDLPTSANYQNNAEGRYFSIVGPGARSWYLNNVSIMLVFVKFAKNFHMMQNETSGCSLEKGWLVAFSSTASEACSSYFTNHPEKVAIYYSPVATQSYLATNFQFADVLAVWVDIEDACKYTLR